MTLTSRRFLLRHSWLLVGLMASVMCFAGIFQHGLWTPDEPREAEIGREMLLSHWSAMPTLGGEAFLEKPPLFPWVMAVGYRIFGISPGIARLPAALFSIGSVLAAYLMGRRAGGRRAGVFSALVLCTTAGFALVSHSSTNDTALTCFVSVGHLAFLVARDKWPTGKSSLAWLMVGLCAGLAFLTKGFIGPVLLFGPALLAMVLGREWGFLRYALPRAIGCCAVSVTAIGLPWVLALAASGGWSAVSVCLWDNTLGRGVATAGLEFGHTRGPAYYLGAFPADLLPWTLVLPAVFAGATLRGDWRAGRARFLALIVVAGILLLSLPATKRGLYAMPLLPAAATLAGVWLSRAGSRNGSRFDRATLVSLAAIVGTALLAVASIATYVGSGGTLPERAQEAAAMISAQTGPMLLFLFASATLAVGGSMIWIAVRFRTRSLRTVALAVAASVGTACLVWHAAGTPLLDPIKDMRRGAEQLALTVSRDEPLLGLALDETSRAVIPFYSGRIIRSVTTSAKALEELATGPSRHLVVMEPVGVKLDADLHNRLHALKTIRLSATRELTVYRYETGL